MSTSLELDIVRDLQMTENCACIRETTEIRERAQHLGSSRNLLHSRNDSLPCLIDTLSVLIHAYVSRELPSRIEDLEVSCILNSGSILIHNTVGLE